MLTFDDDVQKALGQTLARVFGAWKPVPLPCRKSEILLKGRAGV